MNKFLEDLKTTYARDKFLVFSNIAVMTVTFLVLGFFLSTAVGMRTAIKTLENQAQITLFFKDDFSEDNITALKERLLSDARVNDVKYISKQQAYEIFMDVNKDEPILLEAISPDILPASLEIRADKLASLNDLASEFEGIDGIEEVKFFRDIVDRFRYWTTVINVVGGVLVFVFTALSFAVVMATIRVNISSKGDEIEILKLVGATDAYVKLPFVRQSMFFGIFSAFLASVLLILMFSSFHFFGLFGINASVVIFSNVTLFVWLYLLLLVIGLMGFGCGLGYFGSHAAIKRYLNY